MSPEWSNDSTSAVENGIVSSEEHRDGWTDLGTATPVAPDEFLLDLRDGSCGPDTVAEVCLAGAPGPLHEPAYPAEEVRLTDGVLHLRVTGGPPEPQRHVWLRAFPPDHLQQTLRDGLRVAQDVPLAEEFAERRLAGAPEATAEADGLTGADLTAFRACLSAGLRLVWAPQGSATSAVLGAAVTALAAQGRRVLLVSPQGATVDEVLLAAGLTGDDAVRVGPAHAELPAGLRLAARSAPRSADTDRERAEVAARLREFADITTRIEELRAELGDFDEESYQAAVARCGAEGELSGLRARLPDAAAAVDIARRATFTAARHLQEALTAAQELDPVRDALAQEATALTGLATLERRQQALEEARAALAGQDLPAGRRARKLRQREIEAADEEIRRFSAAAAGGRQRWLAVQQRSREIVGSHTVLDVERADNALAAAETEVTEADWKYREARAVHAEIRAGIEEIQSRGAPTDEDAQFIADADQRGLPGRAARLAVLGELARGGEAQRDLLRERHRELTEQSHAQRAEAEAEILQEARVVASTVARCHVHPALARTRFDVVLVADAGAAALPEVLFAVCRAGTTAVLFGDATRPGPEPESTCFTHLGLTSAEQAEEADGCVVLARRRESGPALRTLIGDPDPAERSADIVLIDVSEIPHLAAAHPGVDGGHWSAAGALLARSLAGTHAADGPVGALSVHRAQAAVTLAALRDRDLVADVAVGTVSALRTRTFPTGVFDLTPGGIGGSRESATFDTGITRARQRLFIVTDASTVRAAQRGPLRTLRDALDRGAVEIWNAAALLGVAPSTSVPADLRDRLRQEVGVDDDPERHLATARHTVWAWSPWPGEQTHGVAAMLAGAARRGVDVCAFVRPDDDRAVPGATLIPSEHENGRIIVVDGRVVLLGSPDTLVTVEGPAFAGRVLHELHAAEIATPQACPRCGEAMAVVRDGSGAVGWQCRTCHTPVPTQRTRSATTTARST